MARTEGSPLSSPLRSPPASTGSGRPPARQQPERRGQEEQLRPHPAAAADDRSNGIHANVVDVDDVRSLDRRITGVFPFEDRDSVEVAAAACPVNEGIVRDRGAEGSPWLSN